MPSLEILIFFKVSLANNNLQSKYLKRSMTLEREIGIIANGK